jgi:hypothetical protein
VSIALPNAMAQPPGQAHAAAPSEAGGTPAANALLPRQPLSRNEPAASLYSKDPTFGAHLDNSKSGGGPKGGRVLPSAFSMVMAL